MITFRAVAAVAVASAFLAGESGAGSPPIDLSDRLRVPFAALDPAQCTGVSTLPLSGATITAAQVVPAGAFQPLPIEKPELVLPGLPMFCRVAGTASPTLDSIIKFEVWIPFDNRHYRNRYLQVGNGGFSGQIPYLALADGLLRGYATAATDDGSQAGGLATFVVGHPEKVIDYGHRALKETTDKAKAIIRAVWGHDPVKSYFHGCSNGGREALMEAQRYPEDFDGIVAGAPANFFTHQFTAFVWNSQRMHPAGSTGPVIKASLLKVLSEHVRAQCAGLDGGLEDDTFLTNPAACPVNFSAMRCAPGQDPHTCFNPAQIDVIKSIYAGPVRSDTGRQIYPGFEPGAESYPCNWGSWLTGKEPADAACLFETPKGWQRFFAAGFFGNFVHPRAMYDINAMNFSSDVTETDRQFAGVLNATNPDLSAFFNRGGKLIQYHGFDDTAVAPRNSINYWNEVGQTMRGLRRGFDIHRSYRLFMVPGMSHCALGDGANVFGNVAYLSSNDPNRDVMRAMERWVESGVAPERIVARHLGAGLATMFERPLCPYPSLPRYTGAAAGPLVASSWACTVPVRFLPRDLPKLIPHKDPIPSPGPVEILPPRVLPPSPW